MKCYILSIYNTLRYGISRGEFISGHELIYTGKQWFDYWIMKCANCGKEAACEVGPDGTWEVV